MRHKVLMSLLKVRIRAYMYTYITKLVGDVMLVKVSGYCVDDSAGCVLVLFIPKVQILHRFFAFMFRAGSAVSCINFGFGCIFVAKRSFWKEIWRKPLSLPGFEGIDKFFCGICLVFELQALVTPFLHFTASLSLQEKQFKSFHQSLLPVAVYLQSVKLSSWRSSKNRFLFLLAMP